MTLLLDHRHTHRRVRVDDGTSQRVDPTGTGPLRGKFRADLDRRWARLRNMTIEALSSANILGMGAIPPTGVVPTRPGPATQHSPLPGVDKVAGFSHWLDEALRQVVLGGDGTWTGKYIDATAVLARSRAAHLAGPTQDLSNDRLAVLRSVTIAELQGVCDAVNQHAIRVVAEGIMLCQRPLKIARAVAAVVDVIGKNRARQMANHMVVKTFAAATLDAFRAQGVTRVGTQAERVRVKVGPYYGKTLARDAGSDDEPRDEHGRWTNEGVGAFADELVKKHGLARLNLFIKRDDLNISDLEVPKENQKSGVGSAAMRDIVEFADKHNLRVTLTPGLYDDRHGTTSRSRLVKFYKRFGFVENKGRNKDFSISEGMLRNPQVRDASVGWRASTNPKASSIYQRAKPPTGRVSYSKSPPSPRQLGSILKQEARLQSLGRVDVLTAGDDLVCEECQDISDGGPYDIDEAESLIPAHLNCRCAFVPADDERFAEVSDALSELLLALDAYNPDQPRVPAGSPDGGEFAGGGAGGTAQLKVEHQKFILGKKVPRQAGTERTKRWEALQAYVKANPDAKMGEIFKNTPYTKSDYTLDLKRGAVLPQLGSKPASMSPAPTPIVTAPAPTPSMSTPSAPAPVPTPTPPGSIDVSKMTKVGEKMGSNKGGVYQDEHGLKYYVKEPQSPAHVMNELLAVKLYQLAGVKTLDYVPVVGGNHVATRLEALEKNNVSQLDPEQRTEAQKNFAVHAWLANWDAAGTGGDNQGVIGGKVTTLDVGGALEYRAQGSLKGDAFGHAVNEYTSMRSAGKSPDNAKLFGSMTTAQLGESVAKVANIPDQSIRDTVLQNGGSTALADKLVARKADLVTRHVNSVVAQKAAEEAKSAEEAKHATLLADPAAKALAGKVGIESVKSYIDSAAHKIASKNLTGITPSEAASIVAYSGSHYNGVNAALRAGVMTEEQHHYAVLLNSSLDKLPPYVGVSYRKASMPESAKGLYQPGMVIEERAFTSTSKNSSTWHGDLRFEIHGKSGRDISKLSSHPDESEVLFKSGSRFKVTGREGNKIILKEI